MSKAFILGAIIITLSLGTIVFAQESPFGDLGDEAKANRTVLTAGGSTLSDYLSVKSNYLNLLELHDRAFGTRKTELASQLVSRAKDLLIAKLGAPHTYLVNLFGKVGETKRFSEQSMASLQQSIEDYNASILSYQPQIEEATSLEELELVSFQMNRTISTTFDDSRGHVSILSIARGQFLISLIDEKATVIQAHINASADLGGNVAGVQGNFNESMLNMEEARDAYKRASGLIGDGSDLSDEEAVKSIENGTNSANLYLRRAYDGLAEVLGSLRVLYSQSPWEIDSSQFVQEEPEAPEEPEQNLSEEGQ